QYCEGRGSNCSKGPDSGHHRLLSLGGNNETMLIPVFPKQKKPTICFEARRHALRGRRYLDDGSEAATGPLRSCFGDGSEAEIWRFRCPCRIIIFWVKKTPALAVLNANSCEPGSMRRACPSRCEVSTSPSIFTSTSTAGRPRTSVTTGTTDGISEASWMCRVPHSCSNVPHDSLAHARKRSLASIRWPDCSRSRPD